jgi:HlyD family secretion protein
MNYLCTIVVALSLLSCSAGDPKKLSASGTIEGTDVNIGSEVAGKIAEVRVEEGSRVKAGDTLLTIDDAEYQIQLEQAVANFESVDAAYRLAVEGSRREDIVQAEAAFSAAEADYNRMKALLASQTATQKQYDDAYSRYVAAQQTFEKLKAGSRREEIVGALHRKVSAAAQVDLLKKRIHDCRITAPSAGIITLRAAEPGELVTYGTNVLRLTYLDKVKLTIYLNEVELGNVHLGQAANVFIDSAPDKPFPGAVTYISPIAEFTPKNVQTKEDRTKLVFGVKIEIPNPDGVLKAGMPADATIPVAAP